MKFARYLEETQTPEWKKKYIDYRGLKKKISAIKQQRATTSPSPKPRSNPSPNVSNTQSTPSNEQASSSSPVQRRMRSPSITIAETKSPKNERRWQAGRRPSTSRRTPPSTNPGAQISPASPFSLPPAHDAPELMTLPPPARSLSEIGETASSVVHSPRLPSASRPRLFSTLRHRSAINLSKTSQIQPSFQTYAELLSTLAPIERAFFEYLEQQLEKAEAFYQEREKEAVLRSAAIKEQLKELSEHRQLFYQQHPKEQNHWLPFTSGPAQAVGGLLQAVTLTRHKQTPTSDVVGSRPTSTSFPISPRAHKDPESYPEAKKALKLGVLEFYRFLEHLNNFRILNLTAIRKAIKKFEKTTNLTTREIFNREQVEHLSMSNERSIQNIIKDLEDMYAARFEKGDLKAARTRLRTHRGTKTHHFSVFRSGMMLGLAIPPILVGLYQLHNEEMRERVPVWLPLLVIYATLFIPALFALLVGANIIVWARSRINYPFIFELDLRTVLDGREYLELPSFFILTLAYAFMFSFTDLLSERVSYTVWPLVWLGVTLFILFVPLPIIHWKSRSWLLKNWQRLCIPGFTKVEFADFWMGDQMCSMAYTFTRLSYLVCVYTVEWDADDIAEECNMSDQWVQSIVLSSLPSMIRLIQSIRRWVDSGLIIHLVNGGKYSSSILAFGIYNTWRHAGAEHDGLFVAWVLVATFSSLYTSAWDLLMDWSLLRPHSPKPLLRADIMYANRYLFYYFAIVTNVLIRFAWVIYIPESGPNFELRSFIVALLEMLRRVQWNFIRVENEHLGNADRYRVTREVPLPYSFDEEPMDADSDNEDEIRNKSSGFADRSGLSGLSTLLRSPRSTAAVQATVQPTDPTRTPILNGTQQTQDSYGAIHAQSRRQPSVRLTPIDSAGPDDGKDAN